VAIKTFKPSAPNVAKVITLTIGGTLAGETFTISIGGDVIASHTDTDTVIASTVAALVAQFNSSTHLWALEITAGDNSPDITLTADVAGVPFDVTVNTPGGSATFNKAITVANSAPNDLSVATNWTGNTLPTSGDEVHISDLPIGYVIPWGLDAIASVVLDKFVYHSDCKASIGLPINTFTKNQLGTAVESGIGEYRQTYLQLKVDKTQGDVEIGTTQPALTTAYGRIKLDLQNTAARIDVRSAIFSNSLDASKPGIRLLANHSQTELYVREARCGIGIAIDDPSETSLLNNIVINSQLDSDRVQTGDNVTLSLWTQYGGDNILRSNLALGGVNVDGGQLVTEGEFAITTLTTHPDSIVYPNNTNAAGNAIGTLNAFGGIIDGRQSAKPRTWNTMTLGGDANVYIDDAFITVNTINVPAARYKLSIAYFESDSTPI